jgi:hypothetical protein
MSYCSASHHARTCCGHLLSAAKKMAVSSTAMMREEFDANCHSGERSHNFCHPGESSLNSVIPANAGIFPTPMGFRLSPE